MAVDDDRRRARRRGASRRRRSDCRRSRRPRRAPARPPQGVRQPLGGARGSPAACSGSAEMLGIAGTPCRTPGARSRRRVEMGLEGGSMAVSRSWSRWSPRARVAGNGTSGPVVRPARRLVCRSGRRSGRLRVRRGARGLVGPTTVGGVARRFASAAGRVKSVSNSSVSTVSSATSFSARAVSLSRWVTRTSIARS